MHRTLSGTTFDDGTNCDEFGSPNIPSFHLALTQAIDRAWQIQDTIARTSHFRELQRGAAAHSYSRCSPRHRVDGFQSESGQMHCCTRAPTFMQPVECTCQSQAEGSHVGLENGHGSAVPGSRSSCTYIREDDVEKIARNLRDMGIHDPDANARAIFGGVIRWLQPQRGLCPLPFSLGCAPFTLSFFSNATGPRTPEGAGSAVARSLPVTGFKNKPPWCFA